MNDMLAETELFSAVAGMAQDPPADGELLERIAELEKVVELYHVTEQENPGSQLLGQVRETFQASAGSMMTEDACHAYWNEFEGDAPFSVTTARMKIGAMMHQQLGVDAGTTMKLIMLGPAGLDIDECLDTIKAVSEFTVD